MPIERGQDWGCPGPLPAGAVDADDDAAVAAAAESGATHVRPRGGDLARTLGISERTLDRAPAMLLPVDLIRVTLDDGPARLAAAHVAVGSRRRPTAVVMNAAFRGRANLAPRAHPGDGRLDLVRLELRPVDWIKARRRMPTGTHVPHPGITIARIEVWEHTSDRTMAVTIDGRPAGRCTRVQCAVVPDALIVGV